MQQLRALAASASLIAFVVGCPGRSVEAGIRLVSKAVGGGLTGTQVVRLDGGKLRMDIDAPATMSLIYTPKSSTAKEARLTHLDHSRKAYARMSESQIRKMGADMRQVQSQASALLATLPTELRKQAEAALGSSASAPKAASTQEPIQLKATGRKDIAGRYACEIFSGTAKNSGEKVPQREEVCVARLEALGVAGLRTSDFQAMSDLTRLYSSLSGSFGLPQIPRMDPVRSTEQFGFEGFPVRVRRLEGSKVVSETTLEDIQRDAVDASLFRLPANYKKQGIAEIVTGN